MTTSSVAEATVPSATVPAADGATYPDAAVPAVPERGLIGRTFLGRRSAPVWQRPALWTLLVTTALLYFWNLANSGYANDFYAASVKSATQSWTALLWASLDSGLSITVDKPPAAIWIMGLSGRLFGFSSWSMLAPQALMGVLTVFFTYAAVTRVKNATAGLIAGAIVALTPVAAMMFRFNNPDALLTLCLTAATYAVVRALETSKGRRAAWWMMGAGWLIGLAFLTKMLQGLLILPAIGLAYLLFAPRGLLTRLWHLLLATLSLIVSAGWLIALCAVWPASSRPYIGGSTDNSLWDLAMGYNGLARIFGGSGSGGGMGGNGNTAFGGATGILRMFGASFGAEISWFLPAALVLLLAGLVAAGRRPRTDLARAGLVAFGGSMIVTALVFSFMSGTVHPYYAVALAPFIAGTAGIGATMVWDKLASDSKFALVWRGVMSLTVAGTAAWGFYLLATHAASWYPALRWTALVAGFGGALVFFVAGVMGATLAWRRPAAAGLLVAALRAAAPSAAWTLATVSVGHSGSIPMTGPSSASGMGGGMPSMGGAATTTSGTSTSTTTTSTTNIYDLLNAAGTKWSAAVVGDQSASGYILNTNTAVFCIGGWTGSDNNVTLDQFKALVSSGQIHYFLVGGGMGGGPGGGSGTSATQITSWVTSTFTSSTVGGVTVYDLTTQA